MHISKVDPIDVRFSIPERDYLFFAKRHQARLAAADGGVPAASVSEFQLFLADGSQYTAPGTLAFVDRNVDARTGTILLEAAFRTRRHRPTRQ